MNLHSSMLDDITEEDLLRMELGDFPSPPSGLAALDSPSAVEAALNRGPAAAHEATTAAAVAGPSPARTPSKRKRATLPTVAEATPPLPPSRSPQLPLDVYTSGIGRGGSPSLRGMTTRRVTPTASPAAAAAAYRSPVLSPLAPHSASGIRISTPVSASAPPPLSLTRSNSSRPRSAASTPGTPYSGSATPTGSSCRRPEFDDLTNCALCRSGYKNGDKWRNVRRVHIHWYLLMESGAALCAPSCLVCSCCAMMPRAAARRRAM